MHNTDYQSYKGRQTVIHKPKSNMPHAGRIILQNHLSSMLLKGLLRCGKRDRILFIAPNTANLFSFSSTVSSFHDTNWRVTLLKEDCVCLLKPWDFSTRTKMLGKGEERENANKQRGFDAQNAVDFEGYISSPSAKILQHRI